MAKQLCRPLHLSPSLSLVTVAPPRLFGPGYICIMSSLRGLSNGQHSCLLLFDYLRRGRRHPVPGSVALFRLWPRQSYVCPRNLLGFYTTDGYTRFAWPTVQTTNAYGRRAPLLSSFPARPGPLGWLVSASKSRARVPLTSVVLPSSFSCSRPSTLRVRVPRRSPISPRPSLIERLV